MDTLLKEWKSLTVNNMIPTREVCSSCGNIIKIGFHVPNKIWKKVVHPSNLNNILCLECFTRKADEKLIEWDKEIKFYPVSFYTHLSRIGKLVKSKS